MKIKTINKKEFINLMAETNGMTAAEAAKAYTAYLVAMRAALKTGKRVLVGDMYRIEAVMRKGGKRINPKTQECLVTDDKPRLRVQLSPLFAPELSDITARSDE